MKLYRFRYSPFARKVQMLLDLLGHRYELIEVPYSDRRELATVTGGYIYVPVLVDDDGTVHVESRDICLHLLARSPDRGLVPRGEEAAVWGYADFADGVLEDVLFRIASPAVRAAWSNPSDRALYVLIKERKFGMGCVDQWQANRAALIERARVLLSPTAQTLAVRPFLFGQAPTLADAALYGLCAMMEEADPALLPQLAEALVPFMRRVEAEALARKT